MLANQKYSFSRRDKRKGCKGSLIKHYSVHVQNSTSGNLPETHTQAYVLHRDGQNVNISYDHYDVC